MNDNNYLDPAHYKERPGPQPIEVTEHWGLGFHLGNVIKYIYRAGHKTTDPRADIDKAIWYLQRYRRTLNG